MADDFLIRRLAPGDDYPWSLLLLADPSREVAETYLAAGHCFLALSGGRWWASLCCSKRRRGATSL